MRRGIATYRFLVALAPPIAIGAALLTGYAAQRVLAPCCTCQAPPTMGTGPPPAAVTMERASETAELSCFTLFPGRLSSSSFSSCSFEGDWRGQSFRGVRLSMCDLSRTILSSSQLPETEPPGHQAADLTGATYDRGTLWPAGFDQRAAGARLAK